MSGSVMGQSLPRVDGPLKVTGQAPYAADIIVPELTHGSVVSSGIAKGWIRSMDTQRALDVKGVLAIFTHENRPRTAWFDRSYRDDDSPDGSPFRPLASDRILFSGQPVALVIAETLDVARYAASLIAIEYGVEPSVTSLESRKDKAFEPGKSKSGYEPPPKPRGKPEAAFTESSVTIEGHYSTPMQHHNPMETHASTVIWEDSEKLTIYDKTQGVLNTQAYVCNVFNLKKDMVRILSPFVGGAFGSGLRPQYQLFLAVMSALELKRSVRVNLSRPQMFTFGHRPRSLHTIQMGTDGNGQLQSIMHEAISETSQFEDYTEQLVAWSGSAYRCDNIKLGHKIARLDTYTPLDMRAPGAASGVYALETAIDEMAFAAGLDPLDFRRRNYASRDHVHDKPFSSKELMACYDQGASRFGWSKRPLQPRSMREGHQLIGWGMATGMWEAYQRPAAARAILTADGRLIVSSATSDFGTGTYTIMSQIAAETMGVPMADVVFKLGDSSLAFAPLSGGSFTASSVGTAVQAVCQKLRKKVFDLAKGLDGSPFAKQSYDDAVFADGFVHLKSNPKQLLSITNILRYAGVGSLDEEVKSIPNVAKQESFTRVTHSAAFVEVRVDEDFGTVAVTRVVSAVAAGKILNPLTARSQILGGVVWGLSMALQEESMMDHKIGRFMNHDLAEYHIPVQADSEADPSSARYRYAVR
ncbi:MAG: xanthine dehydrogenase family protein molybdopterin-binding subunit [Pseudobdellovibrionaceae bacterium]|nr:xanthine dehydrogenase family protein molybdopterin-binding subunit [Pseudobdellovibrionaceae bacterium]